MKPIYLVLFLFLTAVWSCGNYSGYPAADNALEAGREFIDGCLKGDFSRATFYMIDDEENTKHLLQIKKEYTSKTAEQKQDYAAASIIVQEEETVNDSVHVIHYMNSYDKIARKVKVIFRKSIWQADFKYTFDGNL